MNSFVSFLLGVWHGQLDKVGRGPRLELFVSVLVLAIAITVSVGLTYVKMGAKQ